MPDKNRGNKEYYNLLKDYIDTNETGTSTELNQTKQKKRQKKASKRFSKTNYSEVIGNISNSGNNGRAKYRNSTKNNSPVDTATFSVTELVKKKLEKKNAVQKALQDSIKPTNSTTSTPIQKKALVTVNDIGTNISANIKPSKQNKSNSSNIEMTPFVKPPDAAVIDNNSEDESSDDDFDDDDFEDVNINPNLETLKDITQDDSVTVTINLKKSSKQRNNSMVISKEHRLQRKRVHMMYIACVLLHGRQLNCRLNNKHLQAIYAKIVPKSVYCELHPSIKKKNASNLVKSRYFLDGLRHLMELWIKKFRITFATGIFKLNWNEIETDKYKSDVRKCLNNNSEMNRSFYFNCLAHFNGNRDLGAQAFVALLRSVQIKTRLVFSIQPPNFTITAPISEDQEEKSLQKSNVDRIPKFGASKSSSKSLLQKISNSTYGGSNRINETFHLEKILKKNSYLSPYPVFWAEAWDPYVKRWIAIDALNFRILENIHKVSKLEPPLNDERNSLLYVVAFDKLNNLKDVTRRYASKFNSKTRKKRITRDNNGYKWYEEVISKISSNNLTGKNLEIDKLENEYLMDKSLKEGMPTSINDFRNHPIYVLESQLKPNEIITPKEVCGYVKTGNGNTTSLPVYLRENVHELKSSVGWFHKGRIIKVGERALGKKSKKSKQGFAKNGNNSIEQDDNNVDSIEEDGDLRLYAEFQTELYTPEPVKNGKVPKNGFGNIDIYTDNMIPEGGVLMKLKFAAQAAKILDLDYAPAVTGFKFGYRNTSKPKIDGIVVAQEFEEAIQLVNDNLQEEDIVKQRKSAMAKALRAWGLVFAKLRIVDRLNLDHGKIEDDNWKGSEEKYDEFVLSSDGEEQLYDENGIDNEKEEEELMDKREFQEAYGGGGFLPTDMDQETLQERDKREMELHKKRLFKSSFSDDEENHHHAHKQNKFTDDSSENLYIPKDNIESDSLPDGGFIPEDNAENDPLPDGGFIPEDNIESDSLPDGGFIPEDNIESDSLPDGGFIPEDNVENDPLPDGGLIPEGNIENDPLPDGGFIPEDNIESEDLSAGDFIPEDNVEREVKIDPLPVNKSIPENFSIRKDKITENSFTGKLSLQKYEFEVTDGNNLFEKKKNSDMESYNKNNGYSGVNNKTAIPIYDSAVVDKNAKTSAEKIVGTEVVESSFKENEEFEELEDEEGGFEYEES